MRTALRTHRASADAIEFSLATFLEKLDEVAQVWNLESINLSDYDLSSLDSLQDLVDELGHATEDLRDVLQAAGEAVSDVEEHLAEMDE